ncbi:MAG: hypothetical protein JOZ62_03245 [Acidobacteriaceae bacterium]|nr:hypothetical protein [Acidobacteriaceae bacterium]
MYFKCRSAPIRGTVTAFACLAASIVITSIWEQPISAADSSLGIVNAGVEQSEDGPFVSTSTVFLPGDYLYFMFQIAGFEIKTDEAADARQISLTYEVSVMDANGVALAPSSSGEIKTQLNPEDKDWIPKRRLSFLLPSFVAAGEYHVHVAARDLFAGTQTAKDIPFRIGGEDIQHSDSIIIEHFRFLREENSREALQIPAYRPGDTVYTAFDITGYAFGPENRYHIAYGVTVLRPDGKPFVEKPDAAEIDSKSFYPAQFVPGTFNVISARTSTRGEYVIVLTARDLIANRTCVTKQAFSLE